MKIKMKPETHTA